MSKRLPYYQSEPAEYLAGDVMFCSYAAQGVFSIISALYWQRDCELTLTQVKKRCKGAEQFIDELIDENIIKIEDDNIIISFLKKQYEEASGRLKANSENGKKGAAKRWGNKNKNSESIAPLQKNDGAHIAFRREEKREEEIREDKIIKEESVSALDFLKNSNFNYEVFTMQNKKNVKDWDLMLKNFCYKVDEEGLNYTQKILESRLRRWMSSWIKNENKSTYRNQETPKVHKNR